MRRSSATDGIVVVFSRPSDFTLESEWDTWCDDVHLPESATAAAAWVVTRWEVADRPSGFSPPVGFTHVTIYEFTDVEQGAVQLLDLLDRGRSDGTHHRAHAITGVDVLVPTGEAWRGRREPHDGLTGQVVAYVGPTDPSVTDEWSRWLDDVHVADMMGSGAFADASRWVRRQPARFGPNFFTIYDVELDDVAEAVALSGAAMAPAHAAGRIMGQHSGGSRAALRRTGRHGGRGFRPAAPGRDPSN
jgi:hypothetical protein